MSTLRICSPHLSDAATLPWEMQKKSFFQHYYSYASDYLRLLRRKRVATVFLQLLLFTYCCLMLPIICIALVLCLGHATGARVEACGSGLLRHGLNFSTAWYTMRIGGGRGQCLGAPWRVRSTSLWGGSAAQPLVRGSGGAKPPLKLKAFWSLDVQRSRQI